MVSLINPTGDMAPSYSIAGLGVKVDISDRFAVTLVYDQPFGANAAYPAGSMNAGMMANVQSDALTALASYDVSNRIGVFGGATTQTLSAEAAMPLVGGYTLDMASSSGVGVGVTYTARDAKITGGVRYIWLGDAAHPAVGTFAGNTAVAAGLSVGFEL